MVKFVVVTGGTISGLGKGTCASSIGVVLRSLGYRVTAIKIDPYLNVDAGTISPNEHGEVFVLSDGHEGDLDLGNYERALDVCLSNEHNITTGKVYRHIIQSERNGDFLGATVQVVPHVTDCIQEWILRVSKRSVDSLRGVEPDVCLVEVGGTVGDIESSVYLEALQHLVSRLPREDFCLSHVTYIPQLGTEQKTKPAQHSFRALREAGLAADFVFGRATDMLSAVSRRKLSVFSGVPQSNVIGLPDAATNYLVPAQLLSQNLGKALTERLALPERNTSPLITFPKGFTPAALWSEMARKLSNLPTQEVVTVGIVGKYMGSNDTYLSVVKALEHSACEANVNLKLVWIQAEFLTDQDIDHLYSKDDAALKELQRQQWTSLKSVNGILAPGGFGDRGINGKVAAARFARENKIPYLGICLGMQTALIEGARSLLNLPLANSEEFDPESPDTVIVYMPETVNQIMGGTMRLGDRDTRFDDLDSLAARLYNKRSIVTERHRHRYEFNTSYLSALERVGYHFVGKDEKGERLEVFERRDHPFFLGVQYHPEFTSKPDKPNPCFLGFVLASAGKLQERFQRHHNCLMAGADFIATQS